MCSVVKREFKLANVWLNYSKPEAFYTSQWRFPWPVFIIYRLSVAAYVLFAFIRVMVVSEDGAGTGFKLQHHVMAYITTWTYLALTLHMVLAASVAIWCHCRARSSAPSSVMM
ncbi:uncharacterized protein LOC121367618 isoform X2 [Gigantopelta aegis]|uniref:uncharacterized protein LOC121367618 isoform X2 n=1 Tax=Gigantopelta aegis TaxID=1735272 RepID=UPI001B88C427|nr:uncharacterized protein LOC121367618 isoform X2 [Gigantopelta aegis]